LDKKNEHNINPDYFNSDILYSLVAFTATGQLGDIQNFQFPHIMHINFNNMDDVFHDLRVTKMRLSIKPKPKINDTRVIKKYLWLPKRIDDQIRWLETARIQQVYRFYFGLIRSYIWADVEWADTHKKKEKNK